MPKYHAALISELQFQARRLQDLPSQVDTVFFGGGTPSLMRAEWVKSLLDCIREEYGLAKAAEISLEANPGTLAPGYAESLLEAGVNRLSLGVQSFAERDLTLLGRIHNPAQAEHAFLSARQAGFTNISMDLMFGIPGQSLADWQANMQRAVELQPEHLSLYSLILEPGTPLFEEVQAGKLEAVLEDLSADMFEMAIDTLAFEGFSHYEISNWAKSEAFEARHNKIYWENQPYLGVGAGAHSSLGGLRVANMSSIEGYIQKMDKVKSGGEGAFPAAEETIRLETYTMQQETMMLGLRLTREGVSGVEFKERFGVSILEVFPKEVELIVSKKLAEWRDFSDGLHLVLTRRGILLGNQVFQEFV